MTTDQINSLGRTALKWVGGALVGWATAHGYATAEDAGTLVPAVEALSGAVVTIVGVWLSHRVHATPPATAQQP